MRIWCHDGGFGSRVAPNGGGLGRGGGGLLPESPANRGKVVVALA